MDCPFVVGQRVQCTIPEGVNWRSEHDGRGDEFPRRGRVYTIRDMAANGLDVGLRFTEIRNPPHHWPAATYGERYFVSTAFRPLQERKTDIGVFTRMLAPAPRVREDA